MRTTWLDSTTPYYTRDAAPSGKYSQKDGTLVLETDLKAGTVQVQRQLSDNATWVTIENDANANITTDGIYIWNLDETPDLRILATGNALFRITH